MKINNGKRFKKFLEPLKSKRILAAAAGILVILFILTRGSANQDQIKTQTAQRKDISQQVTAPGKISSQDESIAHFATAGKLIWLGAKEGDYIREGQSIAALDKERYEIALRQAEQEVLVADAELAQVYDDISKAAGAESFQNRIKRTTAEAKKNKAFDNLKKTQRDIKDATLTAPIAGTVTTLNVNVGEEIFPTTEIATIKNTGSIDFVAEVDETDVAGVLIGQKATVTLDSLAENPITSQVKSISPQSVTTTTGATAYEVKIEIPQAKNQMLDMNGQVDINIKEVADALVIPQEATVDDKFVWVKQNGTYKKQEIETGVESDTEVEATSGLQERQEVVISGFDQIGKRSNLQKILDRISEVRLRIK